MRVCRDKALLDEFIKKHESEVHDIMSDFIFNEDLLREIHFKSQLKKAVNKGLEKGMKQGLEKGSQQKALETAKNLLSHNISLDIISSSTGLPIEQVEALRSA